MIQIPQVLSIASVDGLLAQVRSDPNAVLCFPSVFDFRSMLSTGAYIQFLITWGQISESRTIRFQLASQDHIRFLPESPETLLPMLLADEVTIQLKGSAEVELLDRASNVKQGLDRFAPTTGVAIQRALFGPDEPEFSSIPTKGPKIHLLMSDRHGRHGTSHWFYKGSGDARQLRDADDFTTLVRNVISLMADRSTKKFGTWVDGLSDTLGMMLFELIDNTHRWGRQNLDGEPIRSVRGVVFDVKFDYAGNQTRLSDVAKSLPMLGDFIRFHNSQSTTPNLALLEMTVFDGGVGLPTRELRRRNCVSPSVDEEFEATRACLQKWGSTSGQRGRGLGLDRVLELTMQRQGFIYLRTGRLALYRDFATNPATAEESNNSASGSIQPNRLLERASSDASEQLDPRLDGTLFSIVLPFSATK